MNSQVVASEALTLLMSKLAIGHYFEMLILKSFLNLRMWTRFIWLAERLLASQEGLLSGIKY